MVDTKKVKLRATWVREYWADPKNYEGCDTPEDMASLDQSQCVGYENDLLDYPDSVLTVTVAEVQNG